MHPALYQPIQKYKHHYTSPCADCLVAACAAETEVTKQHMKRAAQAKVKTSRRSKDEDALFLSFQQLSPTESIRHGTISGHNSFLKFSFGTMSNTVFGYS